MDIEQRIQQEISSYIQDKGKQPNKVYISRDLCGELGINITIEDRELLCDDWVHDMKVVPTWFTNTIFVTYDEKLDTKDMLIDKLMTKIVEVEWRNGVLVPKKISEELDKQIDEDLKYLHNEILFEEYYKKWCDKNK